MPFRHVVLFRLHNDATDADADAALADLRALGELPGVEQWRVERSLDERKGTILVEEGTFADARSFELFRSHRQHAATAATISQMADWWVADYET